MIKKVLLGIVFISLLVIKDINITNFGIKVDFRDNTGYFLEF